ncbi:tyrosine-type recombinase/integrase [Cellulomonas sp. GbtcB1]|uniref:tyrosine-type recombinase/integrase n=1 Tax=Cellulomonas sp. GbtcB1 TaxID=2824746 RepID=UPI001C310A32|nr:tyrosine-type recombinase/integrase [Cellulomonas sp. GbtcB1]
MQVASHYRLDVAVLRDGSTRVVLVGADDVVHQSATAWLRFLRDVKRSPNTIQNYGSRLASYLSWTALTSDWRRVSLSHLAMWRKVVASTPYMKTNGVPALRSDRTVDLWMAPLRSFYEWADAQGLMQSDVASRMTELKYFAPGTAAGGEHGTTRRVLVDELRPSRPPSGLDPEWIDDPGARAKLERLELPPRDRLLIDLMYFTGIRAGEALSLFRGDMHLGGGGPEMGCRLADPHFHVRMDNPVENGARAKGGVRVLYVSDALVDRYVEWLIEREQLLGAVDVSQHVFVNAYSRGSSKGKAMTYSGVRKVVKACAAAIDFEVTGPHMLRHTFATRLVRGIDCVPQDLDVVQELLGHRSISSTRIYTHDLERAKRAALASIAPRQATLGVRT